MIKLDQHPAQTGIGIEKTVPVGRHPAAAAEQPSQQQHQKHPRRGQVAMERLAVAQESPQTSRGQGEPQAPKRNGISQALAGVDNEQSILLLLLQPLGIEAVHRAAPDAGQLMGNPLDAAITGRPFPQQLQDHGVARGSCNQG